jgi:L-iditol 2-dehydrogenase
MPAAARLHGAHDVRVADEPTPTPRPGESLIRIEAVGLCGSDLHWFEDGAIGDAKLSGAVVPGHEFAGTVEQGPLQGRRVAVDPALPCGRCRMCLEGHHNLCPHTAFAGHADRDGGLQTHLAWPDDALHPLPDGFDGVTGALLEPLGVAIHAFDLGHVGLADTVAVLGCGPIGLLIIQVARAGGARVVVATDPLPHRREAALRAGAEQAVAPEELPDLQVDVPFEAAGAQQAVDQALQLARPGARVVLAGIPGDDRTSFSASLARRKGLTLVMARRMKAVYPRAVALVQSGRVELDWLVTDRFPLERSAEAFASAAARSGLKVVIEL